MKKLTALLLALVMTVCALSACGKDDKDKTEDEETKATEPYVAPKAYPDYEEFGLDNTFVKLPQDAADGFIEYLDGIDTVYEDSAWFFIENAMNSYGKVKDELQSSDEKIIVNNKVSPEKLFSVVDKNRETFFVNGSTGRYMKLSEEDQRAICDTVADQLNRILATYDGINTDYLNYKLSQLVISGYKGGFGFAGVEPDRPLLWVSMNSVKTLQKDNPGIDCFDNLVRHETAHLVQAVYSKVSNIKWRMGPCYVFNNAEVSPLEWTWYTEGSAERLTEKEYGDDHLNYYNQVSMLESIALAKIADEDYGTRAPESVSLTPDSNVLFEYLGADTAEKQTEIVSMMYTQEILYAAKNSFVDYYKLNVGTMSLSDKDELSEGHKRSAAETLTKIFYRDLAESLSRNEGRIEDVFRLIRVWETELNRLTDYDNQIKSSYNKDMIKRYKEIQNRFFEAVAQSKTVHLDAADVKDAFCAYSDAYREKMRNNKNKTEEDEDPDVRMVSKEKKSFIAYLEEDRASRINTNINR